MENHDHPEAWLEAASGMQTPIRGSCFLGRGPSNNVILANDKVSRRHAMIHTQVGDEFWLFDLGSRNGTYLNGRRIAQPRRLADQDQIEVGTFKFTFRQSKLARVPSASGEGTGQTIQDIKNVDCWLLVADIEASTQFARRLPAGEAPRVTANWLAACKQIIDDHGGTINKFLGDGFFAYWPERPNAAASAAAAVSGLRQLQAKGDPRFRMVLHYGTVFAGGSASLGEESLLGAEVNFVFRMEKLASSAGLTDLLSEPASLRIRHLLPTVEECRQTVPGFEGKYSFLRFESD